MRLPDGSERDEDIATVVQPDMVVARDPRKLDERGRAGAPDLVIEIASPATASRNMQEKLLFYERLGVK